MHQWHQDIEKIEAALEAHLPTAGLAGTGAMDAAIRHALFSGGKRMRPVLALAAAELVNLPRERALQIAAAMEYLHTASLILDDLPCMDDALERRGAQTAHGLYGEAAALLAAMSLLNHTYALLADRPLIALACECIGHRGMVAGQAIDLAQVGARRDAAHYLKTTALFHLTLVAPALAAEAAAEDIAALDEFGRCAGMAYQLIDDAQDLDGDILRGESDEASPGLLRAQAQLWAARAQEVISTRFGSRPQARFLCGFAGKLVRVAQPATEAA